MSVESKAIYDTFIQMCEVYMNNNLWHIYSDVWSLHE
jgi:hypothetical protein